MERASLIVNDRQAGVRLDKFLCIHLPDLSRERVQDLIAQGCITTTQGTLTRPAYKVKAGEMITVILPPPIPTTIEAEKLPLHIVYEDEDVLVINKAAGMTVHPAAGAYSGTLVNALLHHCGDSLSGIGGVMRPGIVHRLDKETSGLMLVAKHDKAHHGLSAQLQDRSLKRTYHAFIWGMTQPQAGRIEQPLARSPHDRKKIAVVAGGKSAITDYTTLNTYHISIAHSPLKPFASLVECRLHTGRTHQIRVHMAHIGCPLIGDLVYGANYHTRHISALSPYFSSDTQAFLQHFTRQALHAIEIRFLHPITGQAMQFTSPYPTDIQQLYQHFSDYVIAQD
jgi:23S rRNA pseudouridine1911/1915/1917 synthase